MHRRIADAIKLALTQEDGKWMKIEIIKSKGNKTLGFFKIKITVNQAYSYKIDQIMRVCVSIGYFYGEGLHTDVKTKHSVTFS